MTLVVDAAATHFPTGKMTGVGAVMLFVIVLVGVAWYVFQVRKGR